MFSLQDVKYNQPIIKYNILWQSIITESITQNIDKFGAAGVHK